MASINIQVTGLKELLSATGKAKSIINTELGSAITKSALAVQREAKIEVPVDTGRLQKSINVFNTLGGIPLESTIKPTATYAPYVEYGTPIGTGPHGGPKPFMGNAAKNAISTIERVFKDAVEKISNQLVS